MLPGVLLLIIGLTILGVTLGKILGPRIDVLPRKWYGIAFLGAVVSLVGLVMTLNVLRKPMERPEIRVTAQDIEKRVAPREPEFSDVDIDLDEEIDERPEIVVEKGEQDKRTPRSVRRRREVMEKHLTEDPNGEEFNADDFQYFEKQVSKINSGFDQAIAETITGEPPPERAHMSKTTLWRNFAFNHAIYVRNLKRRAAAKKGPGTAEVKKLVFDIADTYVKLQRVYHNSVTWDRELDYQYVSDLQNLIERKYAEIERIKQERGIDTGNLELNVDQ